MCVCVCVSQFVSESSAILLVLVIKLTKVARRRVPRERDRGGEIWKRQIVEGGCEETFYCLGQTWETCRFTVPPAVALLNYISSGIFWRIFYQTGIFAGFSHYFCRLFMYLRPVVFNLHVCNTLNSLNISEKNKKRYEEKNKKWITRRNVQKTKTKKIKCMVTPEYTLILTPSGSKMALPPWKPPQQKNKSLFPPTVIFQKLKYLICMSVIQQTD